MPNMTRPTVDPSDQMDIRNPLNFQERCYRQAQEFEEAYSCMLEAYKQKRAAKVPQSGSYLATAMVVNSAFSLELYLKCLYHIETRKRIKSHELYELFFELISPARQKLIEDLYAKCPIAGVSLKQILERSNNAFDDWRYKYEEATLVDFPDNQIGFYGPTLKYEASILTPHVKAVIHQASPALEGRLGNPCS